jgi:hypothetical protein
MTRPQLGATARPFLLALFIVVAAGVGMAVYGVRPTSKEHVHHKPGSIVGAETPQLIPDDAAHRQVLIAIAGMAARPDRQKALEAYFAHIQAAGVARSPELKASVLTLQDRHTLREVALDLHNRSRLAKRTLGSQRASLAASAKQTLDRDLSSGGSAVLHAFISGSVKERMKIIR